MSAFLTDVLGSTVALTDPAGAVQTQYTYEPFGATTALGAASSNPFGYTGREKVPDCTTTGRGTTTPGCSGLFRKIRLPLRAVTSTCTPTFGIGPPGSLTRRGSSSLN